jgi:YfiH family protein
MIESAALGSLDSISHGFFTREGGVSSGLYTSLNCGLGSKDQPESVRENRGRVTERLGAERSQLATLYQAHTPLAVVVEVPWERPHAPKADAMVTNRPGLALGVLTADCTPVLFADPQAKVIAAAHAGWRGALAGVLEATIEQMEALGAQRSGIVAAIGPTISQQAYEVGDEFKALFLQADSENAAYFIDGGADTKSQFDLPRYSADRLNAAGLVHVEDLKICTYADESSLFSYRGAVKRGESDYGRQISAILLT